MPPTPMFPLQSALLPGETLPLRIFEPRYSELVSHCLAGDGRFGVVLIAAGAEVGGGDRRNDVGVLARITSHVAHGDGRYSLNCALTQRIRVLRWLPDNPYPVADTQAWPDPPASVSAADLARLEDDIWALLQTIAGARGFRLRRRAEVLGTGAGDDGQRLFDLAARVPIGPADRYAVLAAPGPVERLAVLREAVETVSDLVRFQLSEE